MMAIGSTSAGKPSGSSTGLRNRASASIAPLARNIATAKRMATR